MSGSSPDPGQDHGILAHRVSAKLAIAALALLLAFAVLVVTHFWQLHEAFQESLTAKVQITAIRMGLECAHLCHPRH